MSGTFTGSPLVLSPLSLAKPYNNSVGSAFLAYLTDPLLPVRASSALASLALWPNPARNAATVLVPSEVGPELARLTLYDGIGRAVRAQAAVPGAATKLNLAGLAPSMYTLRVQTGDATATHKLLVE